MKKVLLTIAVFGTIFLSACEKDDSIAPAERTLLKADKGILCRGCADWDINKAGSDPALSTVAFDVETDTVSKSVKPITPKKEGK